MAKLVQVGVDLSLRGFAQFQSQISRVESEVKTLGNVTNSVATESMRMSRALGTAGITMSVLGAAALAAVVPMDKLSDTLERATLMSDGIASSMGITTAAMDAEKAELNKLDTARGVSYGVMNSLILQNVDYSKSSELVSTAMDLAAFSGKKVNQTIEDLAAAVDNASTRTLRQYRITASSEQVFAVYGRTIGKLSTELTEVEKRQAVLNYILQIGKRYAGAYNASLSISEGLTNRLGMRLERLGEILGEAIGPTIDGAVKLLTRLVDSFIALPTPIQDSISKLLLFVGVVGTAAAALTMLLPGLKVIAVAFKALPGLISNTSLAMVQAATAGAKFQIFISGMGAQLARLGGWITNLVTLHPIILAVAAAFGLLAVAITTNFGGISTYLTKFAAETQKYLQRVWHDVRIWGTAVGEVLAESIFAPIKEFDRQGKEAMQELELTFGSGTTHVKEFFMGGAILMEAFAEGLLAGFGVVLDAIQFIVNVVSSFLIGESPPPVGPLSKIDLGGMAIIQAWLDGMSSVSLDQVQTIAENLEKILKSALWKVTDELFALDNQTFALDKVLWPFEDALTRAKAAADLVTIPLLRQQRILQKQLDLLKKAEDAEQRRAEAAIKALEKQVDLMQQMIDADRERLAIIDHEIFIEQIRNKILGQVTSAKLITMKSASRILTDQVAQEELSLKKTQAIVDAEKTRWEERQAALQAQQQIIQDQIDQLEELIQLELDKVTYAEDELALRKAIQVEYRLAILAQERFWKEEQRQINHLLDIINRVPSRIKEKVDKGVSDIIQDWEDEIGQFEVPPITNVLDRTAIDEAKRRLYEIFEPIRDQWARIELKIANLWKPGSLVDINWETDAAGIFASTFGLMGTVLTGSPIWGAIIGGLAGMFMPKAQQDFNNWADEIYEKVWGHSRPTIKAEQIKKDVDAFFAVLFPPFPKTLQEWFAPDAIDIAVNNFLANLTQPLVDGLATIGKKIVAWSDGVTRDMHAFEAQIWADFLTALETIRLTLEGWLVKIKSIWTTFVTNFGVVIETIRINLSNFATSIKTAWTTFTTNLGIALETIRINFEAFITNVKDLWSSLGTNISLALNNIITGIRDWTSRAATNVWNAVLTIGSSIVGGIRQGITNAWEGFITWLGDQMNSLPEWLKKFLGIASPSKKFIPIGSAIAAGIAQGFETTLTSWVRRVQPQMSMVVKGFDRQVRGTTSTSGSNVYHNYYTNPGPTISVSAQYGRAQSPASIRDDIGLMLAVAN